MLHSRRPFLILLLLLLLLLSLSLFVGRYPAPPGLLPGTLLRDELAQRLVLNLRLPRILTACLLGAALAAAGTVLQMILRNPLVEPGFLGVSQGAAFGAALGILLLRGTPWATQGLATLCAGLGLLFSYRLARAMRFGGWILRLILAGIAVSAFFSSGVGLLKYMADPLTQLPDIVFWTLGGLGRTDWKTLLSVLPLAAAGLVTILLFRWRLNLLSMEEETTFSLGTSPDRERAILLGAAVAATAAVISVAGSVAWIGLIVPHIARRLAGADAQRSLPAAVLLGAIFALLCDDLARTLLPGEIPLGILTALLGAVLFLGLMVRPVPERPR